MEGFDEAKSYFMTQKDGVSLYDHISDILLKILQERPDDSVGAFEQLSSIVKQERFMVPSVEQLEDQEASSTSQKAARAAYVAAVAALSAHTKTAFLSEEEQDAVTPSKPEVVNDIVAHSSTWKACGIDFGETETFKLALSMAKLAGSEDSISTVRFWGKLLGRKSDYLVVEATGVAPLEADEEAEEEEPEANEFVYFVCSHAGSEWTRLPGLVSSAVTTARQIKRFLTGDLSAPVASYPMFPGSEALYVRSLVALISADTAISPVGYFTADEDTRAVAEDYEAPDMSSVDSWNLHGAALSALGRVMPKVSTDEEGNETSEPEGWAVELLRAADADNWQVRSSASSLAGASSETFVLRSHRWPGAFATGSANSWTNVYVGYGHPRADAAYTPTMPARLQTECDQVLVENEDVTEDPNPPEEENEE